MAERDITRNGRGQIISYEIFGAFDSSVDSDSYGRSIFNTNGEIGTKVSKYTESSFNDVNDVLISDELRRPSNDTPLNIELGEIALNFMPAIGGTNGPSGKTGTTPPSTSPTVTTTPSGNSGGGPKGPTPVGKSGIPG